MKPHCRHLTLRPLQGGGGHHLTHGTPPPQREAPCWGTHTPNILNRVRSTGYWTSSILEEGRQADPQSRTVQGSAAGPEEGRGRARAGRGFFISSWPRSGSESKGTLGCAPPTASIKLGAPCTNHLFTSAAAPALQEKALAFVPWFPLSTRAPGMAHPGSQRQRPSPPPIRNRGKGSNSRGTSLQASSCSWRLALRPPQIHTRLDMSVPGARISMHMPRMAQGNTGLQHGLLIGYVVTVSAFSSSGSQHFPGQPPLPG